MFFSDFFFLVIHKCNERTLRLEVIAAKTDIWMEINAQSLKLEFEY